MPRAAPRYCLKKRTRYYGHMPIPADVRYAFYGKKQFMVPLGDAPQGETDPDRAAAAVGPLVVEWKSRIAAVRAGLRDPLQEQIDKLAAKYRQEHDSDAEARLVVDVIDFVFREVGGMTRLHQCTALTECQGDAPPALLTAPYSRRAIGALNQIRHLDGNHTPFITHALRWEATLGKSKTSDRWIVIIRDFDAAVGQPLERLFGRHVQTWIDDLLSSGKSTATVRFRRNALSAYWTWMASHELVDGEANPFAGRRIRSRQTKVERAKSAKIGFPLSEVPRLWQEAEAYGDQELSHAIKLAIYMGWRLEELAQLKATDVHQMAGVTYIAAGLKSEAGLRELPVPTAILPLVQQLMQRQDSDGYLIRSTANNKWKLRGSKIGQRFTRLKQKLAYDRRRSFHSLRHSFATMLSAAGCPLPVMRDLLGHAGNDVTLGYVDESDLRDRLVQLDRAIRFPDAAQHD